MQRLETRDGTRLSLAESERILRNSHQRTTRVSVLDDDFHPIHGLVFTGEDNGYAIDGSVSQDLSRFVRRTLTLELANPDGMWTPQGPHSPFYWTRMIKVERGVVVGGVKYYAPLGVFILDTPSVSGRSSRLSITGADRLDRATRSKFVFKAKYSSGARVGATLKSILQDAGVGSGRFNVDDDGQTLTKDRHYEIGDSRMEAVQKLARAYGLDVYADGEGYIVVRPHPDPSDVPIAWLFRPGVDSTLLDVNIKWSRDRFYNHILVIGEDSKGNPIRRRAKIANPANPLSVTGPMGDRLYTFKSAQITTDAQADRVSQSLLQKHALIEEEITVEHVPNPTLEVGDAVKVRENTTDVDARYIVRSLDLPLASGSASLTVKKVRSLL